MTTQLPPSSDLEISKLSKVFDHTTNSYKFYWFLAILDSVSETDSPRISMNELAVRMVTSVWYPLNCFKLSFGKQDSFKKVADYVSEKLVDKNIDIQSINLFQQIEQFLTKEDLAKIHKMITGILLRWVPYRFVRPFFEQELRGEKDHLEHKNMKLIEDYLSVLGGIDLKNYDLFKSKMNDLMWPQFQIARNMGFSCYYVYNAKAQEYSIIPA